MEIFDLRFPIIMEDESGTRAIPVSLSIGITFTNVGEANEYEELYRRADSFMYKAKKCGVDKFTMSIFMVCKKLFNINMLVSNIKCYIKFI